MSVTNADITASLAAIAQQAENWRKLCEHLKLSPTASIDAVLLAAEQRGYAAAVTDYQVLVSDLAKQAKRNRNGQVH